MAQALADRAPDYPFHSWEDGLEKAWRRRNGRPRHHALNAFRCLRRGWLIAPLDAEMALLRAITAEEEAATTLMLALKGQRYPGAESLDPWSHVHKAGWRPFLRIVENVLAQNRLPSLKYQLRWEASPPRLDIHIPMKSLGADDDVHATPDEPLNGLLSEGKAGRSGTKVMDFEAQLQALADDSGERQMLDLIRKEANLRNQLLYAAETGITVVQHPDEFLISKRRPVSLLLTLAIAILQTPKHQLLAVQVLQAYLRTLRRMPADPFDYVGAIGPPSDVTLIVERIGDAPPKVAIQRRQGT